MIFANMNLRAVLATDARREQTFGGYLGLRLISVVVALAVISITALALGYRGTPLRLILALGVAKAFEAVSDVVFGLLQQAEDLRRIALSMLCKGVLSIAAVGIVLPLTGSLLAATLALAVAWGGCLMLYDLRAAARLASVRPLFGLRPLASLARLACPLGFVMGLNSFTTSVPRYAIEASLGASALGHFAAIAYLFVAGNQPMLALGAAVTPRLARHFVSDGRAYRALVRRTLAVAAGLGALGVVASVLAAGPFLVLVYGREYGPDAPVIVWLAAAAAVGFVASGLGSSVTAARRFGPQLWIAAMAIVGCLVAASVLVPRFGLRGAAGAVLVTETIRLVCLGAVYLTTRPAERACVVASVVPATAGRLPAV
jgi:O-antigen/teichoic acid export membrane protein